MSPMSINRQLHNQAYDHGVDEGVSLVANPKVDGEYKVSNRARLFTEPLIPIPLAGYSDELTRMEMAELRLDPSKPHLKLPFWMPDARHLKTSTHQLIARLEDQLKLRLDDFVCLVSTSGPLREVAPALADIGLMAEREARHYKLRVNEFFARDQDRVQLMLQPKPFEPSLTEHESDSTHYHQEDPFPSQVIEQLLETNAQCRDDDAIVSDLLLQHNTQMLYIQLTTHPILNTRTLEALAPTQGGPALGQILCEPEVRIRLWQNIPEQAYQQEAFFGLAKATPQAQETADRKWLSSKWLGDVPTYPHPPQHVLEHPNDKANFDCAYLMKMHMGKHLQEVGQAQQFFTRPEFAQSKLGELGNLQEYYGKVREFALRKDEEGLSEIEDAHRQSKGYHTGLWDFTTNFIHDKVPRFASYSTLKESDFPSHAAYLEQLNTQAFHAIEHDLFAQTEKRSSSVFINKLYRTKESKIATDVLRECYIQTMREHLKTPAQYVQQTQSTLMGYRTRLDKAQAALMAKMANTRQPLSKEQLEAENEKINFLFDMTQSYKAMLISFMKIYDLKQRVLAQPDDWKKRWEIPHKSTASLAVSRFRNRLLNPSSSHTTTTNTTVASSSKPPLALPSTTPNTIEAAPIAPPKPRVKAIEAAPAPQAITQPIPQSEPQKTARKSTAPASTAASAPSNSSSTGQVKTLNRKPELTGLNKLNNAPNPSVERASKQQLSAEKKSVESSTSQHHAFQIAKAHSAKQTAPKPQQARKVTVPTLREHIAAQEALKQEIKRYTPTPYTRSHQRDFYAISGEQPSLKPRAWDNGKPIGKEENYSKHHIAGTSARLKKPDAPVPTPKQPQRQTLPILSNFTTQLGRAASWGLKTIKRLFSFSNVARYQKIKSD